MQTSEGLSEQNSEASYNYQKESIKNSVVINPPDATDSELQPSLFEERRHHCEAIAISNTAASDLNHQSNDYHFAKSPVIEDHQLNCLKTSIEIVIKILKLNDTLLQHVQDEEILLRSISDGKKTKLRYKCKLYEVLNYIDLVKGYISDWNTVWEQRDLADTRYYMPLYNRDMITSVKFNLLHHLYTFLIYLEKIIYYGLELLAYQGIHEVSVSQLQKVIVGIVSYNSFLENIDGYLRNIEALRSSTEGDNWEFSKLPDPIGIRKILQIFSGVRANALSKIFVSLIVESVRQNEKEFQNLNDSNIWQECLSLAGHFHPEPHMLSPVSPVSELNIGEDCSGVSDHENLLCEAGPSHVTPGLSNYDSLITEMHTLYTQDDLNIRKLASVIHLSFMDVQNPKCNQQANWLLLNNQEMPFAQFDSSSMHTRMIPNLISAYKLEFEKACLSHIKQLLENQWTLRGIGCSEFSIGSVLLLSPQQLIEMGKCALNVACSLGKKHFFCFI